MWIYVDVENKWLCLMNGDDVYNSWSIGIGKQETPTNPGIFFLADMTDDPPSRYQDFDGKGLAYIGSRSLDLNILGWDKENGIARGYSIHGTDEPKSIGTKCSLGCIRMLNEQIEELYPHCFLGMMIVIWFQEVHDYINDPDNHGIIDYRFGQKPNKL